MEQTLKGRMQISGTIVMTHKDGSVTQQPFNGSVPIEQVEFEPTQPAETEEEDGNVRE